MFPIFPTFRGINQTYSTSSLKILRESSRFQKNSVGSGSHFYPYSLTCLYRVLILDIAFVISSDSYSFSCHQRSHLLIRFSIRYPFVFPMSSYTISKPQIFAILHLHFQNPKYFHQLYLYFAYAFPSYFSCMFLYPDAIISSLSWLFAFPNPLSNCISKSFIKP